MSGLRTVLCLLALAELPWAVGAAEQKKADWTAAEKKLFRQVDALTKKAVARPHPRLLASAADFARIKAEIGTNDLYAGAWRGIKVRAESILGQPTVERKIVGPRMFESAARICRNLKFLAMAYRLTGERQFLTRAEEEMLNACNYEDWNPRHFLDTSMTCLGMAIGYDWLYDDLDPAKREIIRRGMVRLGLEVCETGGYWQRVASNWGQVCNAGCLSIALALVDSERPRTARLVTRAVSDIQPAMEVYAPHGAYPEGPGYWGYGTQYNVYAIALLESALGSDFGLCAKPGFAETCSFLELATGPSGKTLNYSDGGDGREEDAIVWWFAKRFGRPDILGNFEGPRFMEQVVNGGRAADPFVLLWLRNLSEETKVELPLSWNSCGRNPFAVHRSGWDRDAVFAAIKAGRPSYPHGHQDSGSFWLDAGGVRWVCDLGANDYHVAEEETGELWNTKPESKRWRIFRLGVSGHSTLSFDGKDQDVGGTSAVVSVSDGPESEIVVDLSPNYPMAKSVRRTGKILPGGKRYRITDQVVGGRAGAVVRWQFVTAADVTASGDDVVLAQDGREMRVRKKTQEISSDWQVARNPKNADWENDNAGISVVSFTTPVPRSGALKIAVGFVLTK